MDGDFKSDPRNFRVENRSRKKAHLGLSISSHILRPLKRVIRREALLENQPNLLLAERRLCGGNL